MSTLFLIMWATGSFSTQANAHYQSSIQTDSSTSGGFSAGGAAGGGGIS